MSDLLRKLGTKKKSTTVDDPKQQARDFLREHAADLYQMKNKDPQRYADAIEELIGQTGYGKREFNKIVDHAGKTKNCDSESTLDVYIPDEVQEKLNDLSSFMYLKDHGQGHLTQIVMDSINGFTRSKTSAAALRENRYASYEVQVRTVDSDGNAAVESVKMIDYWNQPFKYKHKLGPAVYKLVDFDPRPEPDPEIYDLFTGFALEPVFDEDLTEFLQFLFVNICGKDKEAFEFFLPFFAHLVQKP